jgi:uridine kinase
MKPVVLGIAGGTASGKTTAAEALARHLGERCLLVTHDRYYRTIPDEHRHDPVGFNFDHPDALDNDALVMDLDRLRRGQATRLPRYDFARHERAPEHDWDPVEPRPVILVEGILILALAPVRERLDHRVFVHTPDDLRLLRRVRRDVAERGRDVAEVLAQYERTVRPMHERFVAPSRTHTHVELDGTTATPHLVEALLQLLR